MGRVLRLFHLAGVFTAQWGIGLPVDGFQAAGPGEVSAFRAAMGVFLACGVLSYGYFLVAKDNS